MKKKWFSVSNVFSALLLVFTAAMIINPEVKGWTIQKLMKIGLFQPRIEVNDYQDTSIEPFSSVLFKDGAGKTFDLASLKGKVVFINFWATWCPPCVAEMPSIHALQKKFANNMDVVFLLVDVDNKYEKSDQFMKKHGYDLKVVNPASDIPPVFFQGSIPTTVILDKKGKMVFRQEGAADYSSAEIIDLISKLSK